MILIAAVLIAVLFGVSALYTRTTAAAIERTYPPAGRLVAVDGVRIHVFDRGENDPGKPAVVLLHGASGNLEDMRVALGDTIADRRVIMIDRPGLGWSDAPGVPDDRRLARQVTLIHDLVERLDIGPFILAGHSLSGALALNYALTYPDKLKGLILMSPVAYPWPGGIALYYTLFSTRLLGPLFAYTTATPIAQAAVDTVLRAVFAPSPMPAGYRERSATDLAFRPETFLNNARDVAMLDKFVRAQSPRYPEITMPAVIITGDRDSVVSPQIHSRALAATLPNATLVVLENTGHMPHHSAQARVAAAIRQIEESAGPAAKSGDKLLTPPSADPPPLAPR